MICKICDTKLKYYADGNGAIFVCKNDHLYKQRYYGEHDYKMHYELIKEMPKGSEVVKEVLKRLGLDPNK